MIECSIPTRRGFRGLGFRASLVGYKGGICPLYGVRLLIH